MYSSTPPSIEVAGLTKTYGEVEAVRDVSFTVARGEVFGFLGPNGAGKSTTINMLCTLARPTSGTATVAGTDCVADARRVKRLIGYMPDTFGSYDNMRVGEYLDFFVAAFGMVVVVQSLIESGYSEDSVDVILKYAANHLWRD